MKKIEEKPEYEFDDLDQWDYFSAAEVSKTTRKYAKPIGHFLISFSELEHILNLAIAEILWNGRGHDVGYLVIEGLSTQNKIDLFRKSYARFAGSIQKSKNKLSRIAKRLKELNQFRNSLVHANWLSVDSSGFVRTKLVVGTEDGYVKFRKTKISPKTINQKIKEIQSLAIEIPDLYEKFLEA